jgi:hypothetical protein
VSDEEALCVNWIYFKERYTNRLETFGGYGNAIVPRRRYILFFFSSDIMASVL